MMRMERRSAMLLIEVVAALALLVSAVTALLLAHARTLEQAAWAAERERAADTVEELVAGWRLERTRWSEPAAGALAGMPEWHWHRRAERLNAAMEPEIWRIHFEYGRLLPGGAVSTMFVVEWLDAEAQQ